MSTAKIVVLEAENVCFFSECDETAFFEWLDKIKCIIKYEGCGVIIRITVNDDAVDETALRELLALFHRYEIAMRQLVVFDRQQFSGWLHDKRAYWYAALFGE